MADWITDRLPTEADADAEGEVSIRRGPALRSYMHWSYVVPGQPWWSANAAARIVQPTPPPAPATTRVVTAVVVDGDRAIIAACNDGTIWCLFRTSGEWQELPSIPQPEASDA